MSRTCRYKFPVIDNAHVLEVENLDRKINQATNTLINMARDFSAAGAQPRAAGLRRLPPIQATPQRVAKRTPAL